MHTARFRQNCQKLPQTATSNELAPCMKIVHVNNYCKHPSTGKKRDVTALRQGHSLFGHHFQKFPFLNLPSSSFPDFPAVKSVFSSGTSSLDWLPGRTRNQRGPEEGRSIQKRYQRLTVPPLSPFVLGDSSCGAWGALSLLHGECEESLVPMMGTLGSPRRGPYSIKEPKIKVNG